MADKPSVTDHAGAPGDVYSDILPAPLPINIMRNDGDSSLK